MRWSVGVRLLVLENAIKIFFTLFSQTLCVAKTAKIPRLQAENYLYSLLIICNSTSIA